MIIINICHLWLIKSITASVINLPIIRMNQNVLKTSFLMITLDNENDTPECESYVVLLLLCMQFTE